MLDVAPSATPMARRASLSGSQLELELLDYLRRHPQGRDTVEGIAHWWLLEQRVRRGLAEVRAALARLECAGFLKSRRQADGQVCYWPDPARLADGRVEGGTRTRRRSATACASRPANPPTPTP